MKIKPLFINILNSFLCIESSNVWNIYSKIPRIVFFPYLININIIKKIEIP